MDDLERPMYERITEKMPRALRDHFQGALISAKEAALEHLKELSEMTCPTKDFSLDFTPKDKAWPMVLALAERSLSGDGGIDHITLYPDPHTNSTAWKIYVSYRRTSSGRSSSEKYIDEKDVFEAFR
jgi:hypothetical protein